MNRREQSIQSASAVKEARDLIDRAQGLLNTLHLGPLDYNITNTIDALRAAAGVLEQFGRDAANE
jgi:hypothetical protein